MNTIKIKSESWHSFLTEQINSNKVNPEINKINEQLLEELGLCQKAENSEEEIYERFYKDVEFGTGGLRGILGVGINRMNIYTVARATQGIAKYIQNGDYIVDSPLKGKAIKEKPAVAIAYDSRTNSSVFAEMAAKVLNANHIDVYLYDELMPTPALSFAVRKYECAMGIMITASHNPAKYNGYKVYDNSGCQVTLAAAEKIFSYIDKLDVFNDVKSDGGDGTLTMIGRETTTEFLDAVQRESTQHLTVGTDKAALEKLSVVYTPLNGAGNKSVRSILDRIGVKKVHIVSEQELPDGNFPTCPYPNPEKREALELGLEYCQKLSIKAIDNDRMEDIPDLLLATDPDCDRIGIAVCESKTHGNGQVPTYKLLSGNEVGVMLLDFMIATKVKSGVKKNPCAITTIVSTKMTEAVCKKHGIKLILTLTGFKFIGEQIGFLENENREDEYLFGFEESYGYLSGAYVRDKDAVNGAMLICEMAAYYKAKGMTLTDRLEELYEEYGYYRDKLIDFAFEGAKGMEVMASLMEMFRTELPESFIGKAVTEVFDYEKGIAGLPKSDVISAVLEGGSTFTARPSGTEPKLKIYMSAKGKTAEEADRITEALAAELTCIVNRK